VIIFCPLDIVLFKSLKLFEVESSPSWTISSLSIAMLSLSSSIVNISSWSSTAISSAALIAPMHRTSNSKSDKQYIDLFLEIILPPRVLLFF